MILDIEVARKPLRLERERRDTHFEGRVKATDVRVEGLTTDLSDGGVAS
jgi:hypothetical protein